MNHMKGEVLKRKYTDLLRSQGFNPDDFLFLEPSPDNLSFVQKHTGKVLNLRV